MFRTTGYIEAQFLCEAKGVESGLAVILFLGFGEVRVRYHVGILFQRIVALRAICPAFLLSCLRPHFVSIFSDSLSECQQVVIE